MMKQLLFFISFLIYSRLGAQELFFSKPTAFQNLPSVETYQVLQDSKGTIWVTTDGGLCKYDGNTITNYTVKDGISENVVLKGLEDKKGRVWFTTLSGYFFYYSNDHFYSIAANEQLKKICGSHPITSFFFGENDTLYCATLAVASLLKIPPQHNYKDIIQVTKGYERCNRFFFLNKLNGGEGVFGRGEIAMTAKNLINCSGKMITVTYKNPVFFVQSSRGGIDKDGNIYFGLGIDLVVVRKATGSIEYHKLPFFILSIYQDKEGDLWIGTKKGGYLYRHSDLTTKPITFLNNYTVSGVTVDRERSVWVATIENGVFKSNNKEILLLNEKGIYFQKDDNQLNITCAPPKIINIFKNDSLHTYASFVEKEPGIPEQELRSCFIEPNYYYFDTGNRLYYGRKKDTSSYALLGGYDSRQILKLQNDTFCSVSPNSVLMIFKDKILKVFVPPFAINYSTKLKDKRVLISSRSNEGVFEFKNNVFIPFLDQLPELKTRINCIVEDSSGNLWFATNEHGLYCYTNRNKKLYNYNSLVSDKLNFLTLDDKSNLWATTNGELIKIDYLKDIQHPHVYTFDQSNGLPNFQLGRLIEFNGKIWCSTQKELFYFESDKLTANKVPPLVYIDRFFYK